MTTRTEWHVGYRPVGRWVLLREQGWDQVIGDDRLPAVSGTPSAFTRFQITFSFPDSDQPLRVKERAGCVWRSDPARDSHGRWEMVRRDEKPADRRYVWDLTQATGGRRP